jgi:hypothetical protein
MAIGRGTRTWAIAVAIACHSVGARADAQDAAHPVAPALDAQPPPTAPVQPPPTAPAKAVEPTPSEPKHLLGDFAIGLKATVVGYPSFFRLGIESKYKDLLGLAVEYGFIPKIDLFTIAMSYSSFRLTPKIYPFKGAFFLGAALGYQHFTGTELEAFPPTFVTATYSSLMVVPHLGWHWTHKDLLGVETFWGLELGAQFPFAGSDSVTSDPDVSGLISPSNLVDREKLFGKSILPHVGFHYGVLF